VPSNRLDGWLPTTPTVAARPVQFETVVRGLCGMELPDGRGFLVWANGSAQLRAAVVSSPQDWLVNNSVTAGTAFTIPTANGCGGASCWEHLGELYINSSESSSPATSRIYKANNPADPTAGWTYIGTALTYDSGGTKASSIPLRLDSGRWIMVQNGSFFTGITGADNLRGVYSDNNGATWATWWNPGNSSYAFPSRSRQLALASDGRFNWSYQPDSSSNTRYYLGDSAPSLVASGDSSGDPPYINAFLHNGIDLFAMASDGTIRRRTGSGELWTQWVATGKTWSGGLVPVGGGNSEYHLGIIANDQVFYFANEYCLGGAPPPPAPATFTVGHIDMGLVEAGGCTVDAFRGALDYWTEWRGYASEWPNSGYFDAGSDPDGLRGWSGVWAFPLSATFQVAGSGSPGIYVMEADWPSNSTDFVRFYFKWWDSGGGTKTCNVRIHGRVAGGEDQPEATFVLPAGSQSFAFGITSEGWDGAGWWHGFPNNSGVSHFVWNTSNAEAGVENETAHTTGGGPWSAGGLDRRWFPMLALFSSSYTRLVGAAASEVGLFLSWGLTSTPVFRRLAGLMEDFECYRTTYTVPEIMGERGPVTPTGYDGAIADRSGGVTNQFITLDVPLGTQPGDLILFAAACTNTFTTALSGWTMHDEVTTPPPSNGSQAIAAANGREMVVWYRFVGSPVPAQYVVNSNGDTCGGIAVYRGVDPTDPIDAYSVHSDGLTIADALVIPSVTTTVGGGRLVVVASGMHHRTWSTPPGMTERWELHTPGSDTGPTTGHIGHTFFDQPLGAAGPTGSRTTTPSGTTSRMGALIALRPSSAGGGVEAVAETGWA
jgi:hypothetical protein